MRAIESTDLPIRCCDLLPQMNQWFRDGKSNFRCVWKACVYKPWGSGIGIDTNVMPGYTLVMYSKDKPTKFIRAVVPNDDVNKKLGILKLMFEERNILSMLHDSRSFENFWKVINSVCDEQYAITAAHCTGCGTCTRPASLWCRI